MAQHATSHCCPLIACDMFSQLLTVAVQVPKSLCSFAVWGIPTPDATLPPTHHTIMALGNVSHSIACIDRCPLEAFPVSGTTGHHSSSSSKGLAGTPSFCCITSFQRVVLQPFSCPLSPFQLSTFSCVILAMIWLGANCVGFIIPCGVDKFISGSTRGVRGMHDADWT